MTFLEYPQHLTFPFTLFASLRERKLWLQERTTSVLKLIRHIVRCLKRKREDSDLNTSHQECTYLPIFLEKNLGQNLVR